MMKWLPMETAPKDGKPILAICKHVYDQSEIEVLPDGSRRLSTYAAAWYDNGHVEDGPNVIVWGGAWDDSTWEYPNEASMPDWWYQYGSDFEIAARPILWSPIDLPGE